MKKINIFISSVGADEAFRQEIKKRITILGRNIDLEVLYESEIKAGDDWRKEIKECFSQSEIVLLLISPDYVASEFHYTEILEKTIQKVKSGGSRVVPVHVRSVSWNELPIEELLPVPKEKNLSAWEDRDAAFLHVKEEIKNVIENYIYHVELSKNAGQQQFIKKRQHDVTCPMCGQQDVNWEEHVLLESIEKLETGYALGGKVKLHYHGLNRCCNCGNVFDDVEKIVPIKIPKSLVCPICDKKVAMKYSVNKIEKVSDDHFTFQAIWDCKFCNYFKPLAKGLKFIRELVGITVGTKNIELERK